MTKTIRKIIRIDESLCNGCGDCIPSCREQALQLVDTPRGRKARLAGEIFCDGLGDCLGHCPTGALTIEEREADGFDEKAVRKRMAEIPTGKQPEGSGCACPSARVLQWEPNTSRADPGQNDTPSELCQWPVQLHLVPPAAPYFQNRDLCILTDCVPLAYADTHRDFIRNRSVAVGCPKFDDAEAYVRKIADILTRSNPKSIEAVTMEVPCCRGLVQIIREAISRARSDIPLRETVITVRGERMPGRNQA